MKSSSGMRPGFQPIEGFSAAERRKVRAVLTDIDDTLTESGRLPAIAYQALENLHEAGLIVIPVTGRPAGWCDMIARQWPVDGVVGENGAFYFRYEQSASRMIRKYMKSRPSAPPTANGSTPCNPKSSAWFPAQRLPAIRLTAKPTSPLTLPRMFPRFPRPR